MNDILDLHTHTLASGHAYNTIMEMAAAAKDAGHHGACAPDAGQLSYLLF